MANPQLEGFLKQVKTDPDVRAQLAACPNLVAVAELGASRGFPFSGADLLKHQAEGTLRLSDDDLNAIAAGVELEGHLWRMDIVWN